MISVLNQEAQPEGGAFLMRVRESLMHGLIGGRKANTSNLLCQKGSVFIEYGGTDPGYGSCAGCG